MSPSAHHHEARALRRLPDEGELPSELLAGWTHGTLTAGERARVEAALSRRERAALGLELHAGAPRRARPRMRAFALAACAVVFAVLAPRLGPGGRAARALHAGDLDRAASLLFGPEGDRWPSPALRSTGAGGERVELVLPAALCFEPRPELAWTSARAGGPYRLRLFDERWREIACWEAPASPVPWPSSLAAPEPERPYLLEVQDLAHPGTVARGAFRVASHARRAELAAALDALAPDAPRAVATFLRARAHAELRDDAGAARELAVLCAELDADARARLLAALRDPSLVARVEALSAARATDGTGRGPP